MKNNINLPSEFIPYNELILCSNKFINGTVILEINKNVALLVGKGKNPAIWLAIPQSKLNAELTYLIKNNKTFQNRINVLLPENETIVSHNNDILIHVRKMDEDKAEIIEINLRPLGISIHGNKDGLYVGTNFLKNNGFSNTYTMIAINAKKQMTA